MILPTSLFLRPATWRLPVLDQFTREEETVGGQARGKPECAAVANEFDNIWMHQRLAPNESYAHGPKLANSSAPISLVVDARMRSAIVVFGAEAQSRLHWSVT